MKERAMAQRDKSTLFSVDAKCKFSVAEPDLPIASVTRGKKVIVGIKKFPRIKNRATKFFKVHGFLVFYWYFTHLKTW